MKSNKSAVYNIEKRYNDYQINDGRRKGNGNPSADNDETKTILYRQTT